MHRHGHPLLMVVHPAYELRRVGLDLPQRQRRRTRPFPMRPCGAWLGSLVGCDVDLTLDTVLVDLRAA
jgi:hypothetical protein